MRCKALLLPAVLLIGVAVTAWDAGNGRGRKTKPQPPGEPTTQPVKNMKITLKLPEKTLTATLHDSPAARQFASMLPMTLSFEDYARTEKISNLPQKLTKEGAPAGAQPSAGDIAYYAPWGNLAIYYKGFQYSDGLILLGKLDGDVEALSAPGSFKATIELAGPPQRQ